MSARAVCGCTPPNVPPPTRDPATIAQGLADAAEHLDVIAYRMFALGDDTGERAITELDALAVGIGRAACELRMRQHGKDGAPCHD
ncbi:MAG: hypothetical protein V4567_02400 [Pseudomonadota bacterium]